MLFSEMNNLEMLNEEYVLRFIHKNKKDRVSFELKKHRSLILHKFANIEHYFEFNNKTINLSNFTPEELLLIFTKEKFNLKKVLVLSSNNKYDCKLIPLTKETLSDLIYFGLPSIIIFSENNIMVIGEHEIGQTPKYLLKK